MTALLFSQMTPPAAADTEFNSWYDGEHVPARLALPGFRSARRYRSAEGTGEYVAVYHVDGLDAFDTDGYRRLRAAPSQRTTAMLDAVTGFTRFTCTVQSGVGSAPENAYLYVVAFPVPPDRVAAYDEWYEREHTDMLMAADGWWWSTRPAGRGRTSLSTSSPTSPRSTRRNVPRPGPPRCAAPWCGNRGSVAHAAGSTNRCESHRHEARPVMRRVNQHDTRRVHLKIKSGRGASPPHLRGP